MELSPRVKQYMHLVIRTDGGPDIGYGHLVRTSALAREFIPRGHSVTFATTTPRQAREVCPNSVNVSELPSRGDPEPFVSYLIDEEPNIVFTDAYPVNADYQQAIRERVFLTVMQDDARHPISADLFVNGNIYASTIEYNFVPPQPRTYLGTKYVLLRQAIRGYMSKDPKWRQTPERAIVTMGGSDPTEFSPSVLRAFDGVDLTVDAIIGPGFSDRQIEEVHAAVDEVSADIQVLRNPDDLAERMFQADFAITTASTTTYELFALGTPIVCLPVADNQEPIAKVLRDRDLATVLPRRADENTFRVAVRYCMDNPQLRLEHIKRGRELVDGRGVERVADEMLKRANKDTRA